MPLIYYMYLSLSPYPFPLNLSFSLCPLSYLPPLPNCQSFLCTCACIDSHHHDIVFSPYLSLSLSLSFSPSFLSMLSLSFLSFLLITSHLNTILLSELQNTIGRV